MFLIFIFFLSQALLHLAPLAIPGNKEPTPAKIRGNLISQLPHFFGKCMGLTNQPTN